MASKNKILMGGQSMVRQWVFSKGQMKIEYGVDVSKKNDLKDSIDILKKLVEALKTELEKL